MDYNSNVNSNEVVFKEGNHLEIYFPEEKTEYRLTVSSRTFSGFEDCLIVELPQQFASTFYKGEDFIQCKYVFNNVVYQFGGEIVRLINDNGYFVIIKKPNTLHKEFYRAKSRIVVKLLTEYFVERIAPGEFASRMQGFATIKDASIGGISFLSSDILPNNTIVKMNLLQTNISLVVEIMNYQKVNDKNVYGGKIIRFLNNSEPQYRRLLETAANMAEESTYVGHIY